MRSPANAGAQGYQAPRLRLCVPACAGTQTVGRNEGGPKRKWGPALLPTPCRRTSIRLLASEETNRAFWFRRPAPPRAASGAKASRFGHRGRARYPCGPQHHGLDGQLGVSGPKSFALRFGLYLSNRLSPGDERRASGHPGQRPSSIAGTWRDVRVYRFPLPRYSRLRVRIKAIGNLAALPRKHVKPCGSRLSRGASF